MTKDYGWIHGGQRLVSSTPHSRGNQHSMISAINDQEIVAALYIDGAINGELFLHFIKDYLCPKIKVGDQVIMDNVSFHKVNGVEQAIEECGGKVIYLPPYSPDLSPIELMWSKIKSTLRKYAPRCADTLKKSMKISFDSIQSIDLQGWYKHCAPAGSNIF